MEKKRKKKGEKFTGGEFRPDEFEEPELPGEVPRIEEKEFEKLEREMVSWGRKPLRKALLSAKKKLEQQLLLGVTERALSAESGTEFYGFENIVGVGIGEKMVGGEYTGEECITVYVVAKAPKEAIEPEALVPDEINGIPTDVVVTGELHALPHRGRYRPAPAGVSVGHHEITAGTIGCLVRRGRALYILSNNHVLANSNRATIGDPILQPGLIDGGRVPDDVIARLSEFVPIRFGGAVNEVDCAIAQTSPNLVTPLNKCLGRISVSPIGPQRDMLVKKCGRTTQFTRGRIIDINATVWVHFGPAGRALFRNQIVIVSLTCQPFSAPGDSGSLIVTDLVCKEKIPNIPVGLLFAGSRTHTIANRIGAVLSALNVSIVVWRRRSKIKQR